jgi:hypothetical protein
MSLSSVSIPVTLDEDVGRERPATSEVETCHCFNNQINPTGFRNSYIFSLVLTTLNMSPELRSPETRKYQTSIFGCMHLSRQGFEEHEE